MLTRTTQCRACGAEIGFIKTKNGKTMPVDAIPLWVREDPSGVPYVFADGSVSRAVAMEDQGPTQPEGVTVAYISHFATCPEADKFRKPRKSDRKKG